MQFKIGACGLQSVISCLINVDAATAQTTYLNYHAVGVRVEDWAVRPLQADCFPRSESSFSGDFSGVRRTNAMATSFGTFEPSDAVLAAMQATDQQGLTQPFVGFVGLQDGKVRVGARAAVAAGWEFES